MLHVCTGARANAVRGNEGLERHRPISPYFRSLTPTHTSTLVPPCMANPGTAAASSTTSESPASLYSVFMPGAAQWYANASHGRLTLDIQADTSRFYRMPAASTSYNWARGLTAEAHLTYIQDALAAYGQTLPTTDVLSNLTA